MRAIIVAISPNGVIAAGGRIPWHYAGDLRRFRRVTMGAAVVMGRVTFESIGRKPLAGRRNIVITSGGFRVEDVERVASVEEAITLAGALDVWFIGGARVYEEAMRYCDRIDVTYVPDRIDVPGAVFMPAIDASLFEAGPLLAHEDDTALTRRVFTRRRES